MAWLQQAFSSSLGKKYLMAVSGLLLGGFLMVHAAGVSLIFWGRAAFVAYHHQLQAQGVLLALAQAILFCLFVLHATVGLTLWRQNRRARSVAYQGKKSRTTSNWSATTMPYTGLALLAFLGLHLADFHGRASGWPLPELVATTLSPPVHGLLYLLALIALALHLQHGFWSLLQSLGVSHPRYDSLLRWLSKLNATIIVTIFLCIILLHLTIHNPLRAAWP